MTEFFKMCWRAFNAECHEGATEMYLQANDSEKRELDSYWKAHPIRVGSFWV